MKIKNWAVVHLIHVQTPHRHIAKLFITDVPEDVPAKDIRSALTRAGYQFGEFGMPWANHYLSPEEEWEDEVIGAFNRDNVERIDWDKLTPKDDLRRITLRVPAELYEKVVESAEKQGVSINTFCVSALSAAVTS